MKTISIKQLHAETGRWVRAAKKEAFIVTDHGEHVATLKPHVPATKPLTVFSLKSRGFRPKVPVDSAIYISEDRDGR
jgi:antitoxin (DNA-binding transcriptional repressor) of toxin-antitoxin stability system